MLRYKDSKDGAALRHFHQSLHFGGAGNGPDQGASKFALIPGSTAQDHFLVSVTQLLPPWLDAGTFVLLPARGT